ncbi:TCR/Tet family MFS transporter [Flavisolibacter ginsenosidimutans]|uniref:TCR/Tet family MFS transporter n=1 Tax=Flavisolibacter ginsenosidimutans TaxID=661481 RepID=A0A5B8UK08_9BACT|nr:TCR/Tet family MFS transporter [Flavisolibacter ginsenosidimutans]QEC56893.1 TCR/Tet family MFS transporter [Flavisolibacter ginsenosidimutans]
MPSNRNAAIGFIFITLLIDVIGFGIIIPVMPKLIEQLGHVNVSQASRIGGWLLFAFAATQFCFSPLVGNLSDRYGRRPVLLAALLGFAVDYLFLSFAPTLGWLFVGRIVAGMTGASFTTASAYIADISTPENRAKNFGMIGAAFGLGFIIGPAIGGLLGGFGARVPFMVAAGLCFLNFLYGFFVLPESLSPENRRRFEWSRAIPGVSVYNLRKFPALTGLMVALFLVYLGSHAVQSNWSFFTIERFHWSERTIGISLAVVGLLVGVVQAGLTRVVNPKLGNEKSIYIGLALYSLGMLLFAFASQSWMMFAFLVPYCLGGICGPALQSVMAGHVPSNQQGELQGSLTGLMSLTTIFGPLIMTNVFGYFTSKTAPTYFPGAPFVVGAVFMTASAVIAYNVFHNRQWKTRGEQVKEVLSQ